MPKALERTLLHPAKASNWVVMLGYKFTKGTNPAAFMLALPTPDAIANEYGCKGRSETHRLARKLIYKVPMIGPKI